MPKKKDKDNMSPKKRNLKKSKNDDSEPEIDGNSDMEEYNELEFHKMLANMFPSKHQNEKVKKKEALNKLKKNTKKSKKNKKRKKKVKSNKSISKKKKKEEKEEEKEEDKEEDSDEDYIPEEEESDEDYIPEEDEDFEDEEDEDEDFEEDELMNGKGMKFNIVFTNSAGGNNNWYEYYDEKYDDEYYEEEEEEEVSDSDEDAEELNISKEEYKLHKKEEAKSEFKKGDKIKVKLKDWDKYYKGTIIKVNKPGSKNKNRRRTMTSRSKSYNIELDDDEYETVEYVLPKFIKKIDTIDHDKALKELEELMKLKKHKGNKAMMKKLEEIANANEKKKESERKEKEKKQKLKNLKKFKKALKGKDEVNDFKYFKDMEVEKQISLIKELKQMNEYSIVEKPYRIQLIESDIPIKFKTKAIKKINTLRWMDPGSGEYYKIKQWVDTFMNIPFGKYNSLPVSIENTKEEYNDYMEKAKKTLDDAVYGLNDAKMQILQLIGQWISNPNSVGTAIAIKGPMGTGKTTLVKEGISKILNRPFAFLALGGATDSSFLEGHSYTYEGSSWGKIVDILIQSKCMNPVIYFDELDKISNTPKGEEITGILTHLTDTTQNTQYHDKYFSSIDFDLSKALFIFSYNDESKVNQILKDRMYRIHTDGYNNKDKCIISNKHLLPKIMKNVNFNEGEIIIPDETIEYISSNLIEKEKGVRNLKRALEIIYTKLNLYRLMKKDSTLFDNEKALEVKFPFTVTVDIVKKLIKKNDMNQIPFGMYV